MARILIVEDNELNLKLMKDILESRSYTVDTALDGQQGLDKVMSEEYDLVLLDIQMPVVSGYDFLTRFKGKTPVVVVSACAMDVEIQRAKDLGCVGYIAKPINICEFLDAVKNVVG